MHVLQEKDNKNLIIWVQDNKSWNDISNELCQINDIYYNNDKDQLIIDPTDSKYTEQRQPKQQNSNNTTNILRTYQSLKLNVSWWSDEFKNRINGIEPYCDSGLYCFSIKYNFCVYIYIQRW